MGKTYKSYGISGVAKAFYEAILGMVEDDEEGLSTFEEYLEANLKTIESYARNTYAKRDECGG